MSRNGGGVEKFLFYRGAGSFKPTLNVAVDKSGGFLLSNNKDTPPREVYTVHVEKGAQPIVHYYSSLQAKKVILASSDVAAKHLQSRLEAKGLFTKEAVGMVKIWRKAMFEKVGQRAMYMMEKADIDKMLPLTITPKPKKQVRVVLVRFECLSNSTKQKIEILIKQLGAVNFRDRRDAEKQLTETGRIGEALMRAVYANEKDPEVRLRLKEILEKITPKNPNP